MASLGHTATTTPLDSGIKDFLGNSVEDDEAFWAEFRKYEAESRANLTKIHSSFLLPPISVAIVFQNLIM